VACNAKRDLLTQFITHLRDEYNLKITFTLSDKDPDEIGACQTACTDAKHQLCFWHALRAIKTRLSVLRRQPAHYNVKEAMSEFSFIEEKFVPIAQQPISQPVRILLEHNILFSEDAMYRITRFQKKHSLALHSVLPNPK
jgi:hypothetical protein